MITRLRIPYDIVLVEIYPGIFKKVSRSEYKKKKEKPKQCNYPIS